MSSTLLTQILDDVASQIRNELVQRTGSIYVRACNLHNLYMPGPPIRTDSTLMGVDLKAIGPALCRTPALVEHLEHAFELLGRVRYGSKGDTIAQIRHCIDKAIPTASLRSPKGWLMDLTQAFVIAAHGPDNDFVFAPGCLTVRFSGRTYRFMGGSVEGPKGYRVLQVRPSFKLPDVLSEPIHTGSYTGHALGGLYRWLLSEYPTLSKEIDWVVGAANMTGNDECLTRGLDVELVTVSAKRSEVLNAISKTLTLIRTTERFQFAQVSRYLSQHPEVFTTNHLRAMLDATSCEGRPYTDSRRRLHRTRLLQIESELISKHLDAGTSEVSVALQLVKEIR